MLLCTILQSIKASIGTQCSHSDSLKSSVDTDWYWVVDAFVLEVPYAVLTGRTPRVVRSYYYILLSFFLF